MRRYASPRRLFPSVEHCTAQSDPSLATQRPAVSRYIRTRRTPLCGVPFSTGLKYEAPNATTRGLLTRLKYAASVDIPARYSTAQPQPDPSRDTPYTLPLEHKTPGDQSAIAEFVEAPAQDDQAAVLGRRLCGGLLLKIPGIEPKQIHRLYPRLGNRRIEFRGNAVYCFKAFRLRGRRKLIEAHGEGATRADADAMASLHFAYQLRELLSGRGSTGASDQHKPAPQQTTVREDQTTVTKDQPGQSPPPINLSLPLDDELLVAMRRTLPELYNATCRLSRANRDAQKLRDAQKAAWTDADTEREISRGMDRGLARGSSVTPQLVRLIDKLKAVPITKRKEEILNLVRANTYTIVVATTGTGKSTQLPQIFLNDSMMNGSRTACRVICVQPRRVAASSLARRVAHERMEKLGDSVGYHVRFNARLPNTRNNITYCTTGIVLQLLQHVPGYLDSISHIVLDEVHERDTDLDMLMLLLRSYVNERLAKGAHVPKIILTSATIDVDLFASYFQNRLPGGPHAPAPHVSIPGRTFKVTRYFLHDVLDSLPRVHDSSTVDMLLKEASTQTYLKRFRSPSDGPARSEGKVAQRQPAEDSGELASPESFQPAYHDNDPLVPLGLICAAIFNVLRTSTNGAILVFLPGMRDILNVEAALCDFGVKLGFDFSAESKFSILKLHSSLPEGHAAPFESVQHGCRRIILATTIAETSVTIPDVKFVIDTGKSRQNRFYPETRSSELAYDWVSKSCVAQRAGRAGRTQSGEYFALFPKDKYESFRVTRAPEMSRCDLASLSLRVKYALPQTRIEDAFRLALEPPADFRVSCSVETLKHMGALDQNEELTTLGRHLLKLPVRPALGKLIYLGVLFRCLDPVLIIAALGDELSLFRMQHEDELRAETSRLRKEYAEASKSDHITTINTFRKLREVYHREGRAQAMEFAYSQHIRYSRFQDALRGGTQLLQILYDNRFIRRSESAGNDLQFGGAALNENSKNISLIKALLLHANSLNIAAPIPKASDKAYLTDGTREGLVASSVNAAKPPRALLVYDSKKPLTSTIYGFVNTTVVTPLAACLFGGPLEVQDNHVCVDTWLKMPIQNPSLNEGDYSIKLLVEMRKALDMALNISVESFQPSIDESDRSMESRAHLVETLSKTVVQVLDLVSADTYQPPQRNVKTHDGWVL